MNEVYALEPTAVRSALVLKMLLEQFGPSTGRYLAAMPNRWELAVQEAFSSMPPVEQQRVSAVLRRARERRATLGLASLAAIGKEVRWSVTEDWRANASRSVVLTRVLAAGIISEDDGAVLPVGLIRLEELDLPTTTEAEIEASPTGLVRLLTFLISFGGDIHLVDPYLDLGRQPTVDFLRQLVRLMGAAGVQSLSVWVRHSQDKVSADAAWRSAIRALKAEAKSTKIAVHLLEDSELTTRMHARHFFSVFGGIAVDNGFTPLSRGGKTKVGPMSLALLDSHLEKYGSGIGRGKIAKSFA